MDIGLQPSKSIVMPSRGERAAEVVELASELVRIPSVTNCPDERRDQVSRCAALISEFLCNAGLEVRTFNHGRYPAVLAGFPGLLLAPVTLCGHFDVVKPEPDDSQFEPRIEGDYLWGRGAADMKTVVASYLIWMRDACRKGPPFPPLNLLLVGNEENGEVEPFGTPHVLRELHREHGWQPRLMVVGERSGENGDERITPVLTATRGVLRLSLSARGDCNHSGMCVVPDDLLDRLVEARAGLKRICATRLTLDSSSSWASTVRFPFLVAGEPGVYNITAGHGVLGIEVRPIPEDPHEQLVVEIEQYATAQGLELNVDLAEAGNTCPPDNPFLGPLLEAISAVAGRPAELGKKLSGCSGRFAPGGNAVVWGQTGLGPHSREERHYIPSIEPYLAVLDEFGRNAAAVKP